MASDIDVSDLRRREWLRASAAFGTAVAVPGCATLRTRRESSIPDIDASGNRTTHMQGEKFAAAAHAAAAVHVEFTTELASRGGL